MAIGEPTQAEQQEKSSELELRHEKIERMLDISHQLDLSDREKISQIELQTKDVKEIINKHGPISVKDWMFCVLYGKDGYYSSGRAKINSGDFTTAVNYLPDISAFIKDILDNLQTKSDRPTIVSAASGGGDFDRNFQTVINQDKPDFHPKLISFDYSLELLKQQKEKASGNDNNIQPMMLSGSATEIPLQSESVDAVFSNELYDAFPSRGFFFENGKTFELLIELDADGNFQPTYKELTDSSVDKLKQELVNDILDQKRDMQSEEPLSDFITWNPSAIEFIKESTRILKHGGISVQADYVQRSNKYTGKGYDDDFRFQFAGNWYNFVRTDVAKYKEPYLDVTINMDPNLIKWASAAYGLEVVSDEPHEDFVKSRSTRTGNRLTFDPSFHVVSLRKK